MSTTEDTKSVKPEKATAPAPIVVGTPSPSEVAVKAATPVVKVYKRDGSVVETAVKPK
jgi:hypothetical protein